MSWDHDSHADLGARLAGRLRDGGANANTADPQERRACRRPWFGKAALVVVLLLLSPSVLANEATQGLYCAINEPPAVTNRCTDDCPRPVPEDDACTASSQAGGGVDLLEGTLGMSGQDLSQPGPTFAWSMARNYSSVLTPTNAENCLPSLLGFGWMINGLSGFVRWSGESANVSLYVNTESRPENKCLQGT